MPNAPNAPNAQSIPTTGYVRLPQILAVFPVSRSSWYAGVKSGIYPPSYKLGKRTTAWKASDIKQLLNVEGGVTMISTLNAKHPLSGYENYPYYEPSSDIPERIARARRVKDFGWYSGLRPRKANQGFLRLLEKVRPARNLDHVSYWVEAQSGAKFILNEPYHLPQGYQAALQSMGLASFCIPTNLAPYCGRWSETGGDQPRTSSILICEAKHQDELDWIAELLTDGALLAPEWNAIRARP
ncbi:helix-turn-helix transcriptional regulator [Nitrosomonas supralitoralis]|uniref:AlpA family phage regulatory protein n=1 Tax=Nitrosomonas supralitoralis TaxID=2116706 RepID=A0A2P7NR01_9PROT|nr:AlpA family phage regulatory protein [Nitrosomonas supralitoralis]PSJ15893.1 hypothetical protein C7H79_16510 [Nitrosomonas supralitoralis]